MNLKVEVRHGRLVFSERVDEGSSWLKKGAKMSTPSGPITYVEDSRRPIIYIDALTLEPIVEYQDPIKDPSSIDYTTFVSMIVHVQKMINVNEENDTKGEHRRSMRMRRKANILNEVIITAIDILELIESDPDFYRDYFANHFTQNGSIISIGYDFMDYIKKELGKFSSIPLIQIMDDMPD